MTSFKDSADIIGSKIDEATKAFGKYETVFKLKI